MKKIIRLKLIKLMILGLLFLCRCEKKANLPTDGDGNVYETVVIGTQTWLTENLKTTKFNNGEVVRLITDEIEWTENKLPAYCWYDNNPSYKDSYGALYNWYAGHNVLLCPVGYHVPTMDEWATLRDVYLDAPEVVKDKFQVIPAGERLWNGYFSDELFLSGWWSSSVGSVNTSFTDGGVPKETGLSVRCVKDN